MGINEPTPATTLLHRLKMGLNFSPQEATNTGTVSIFLIDSCDKNGKLSRGIASKYTIIVGFT